MILPAQYAWLLAERSPKMLVEAISLYGVVEASGSADSPEIMRWAAEVGLSSAYGSDAVPWCGLFMAVVAKRAGKGWDIPKNPLWALNWRKFGTPMERPMLGDVCIKTRVGGGHVALYVGEDDEAYHLLGGNQSDQVCIRRFPKTIAWAFRRPAYINQPANVRRVFLAPTGAISTKEA